MTWQGVLDLLPHVLSFGGLVFGFGMWWQREKTTAEAMKVFAGKIDLMATKIEEVKNDVQETRGQVDALRIRWEERDRLEERLDHAPRSRRRTRN